jgi:hypothetical protein
VELGCPASIDFFLDRIYRINRIFKTYSFLKLKLDRIDRIVRIFVHLSGGKVQSSIPLRGKNDSLWLWL